MINYENKNLHAFIDNTASAAQGAIRNIKSYLRAVRATLFDSSFPVTVHNGFEEVTLNVPVYSWRRLKPCCCSGYVRMTAWDLFSKEYSLADAWNRRYRDLVVAKTNNESLESFVEAGILMPGMVLGVHYPGSIHLEDLDETGNKVMYTHNMLYLGLTADQEPLFAEQFKNKTRTRKLEEFREHDLQAMEILDSRK